VVEFHHHLPGSKTGFVHNDYNIICFKTEPLPNQINPWYFQCSFDRRSKDSDSEERIRAIAAIFYLGNPNWHSGDGGETGLYSSEHQLLKAFAPKNNRLLAFEVSPYSFHGFLSNVRLERNSVIMWYHCHPDHQLSRYPGFAPVDF